MSSFIDTFFRAVFLENLALAYFLGMCTFLAVSKKVKTTLGLGLAVSARLTPWLPRNSTMAGSSAAAGCRPALV